MRGVERGGKREDLMKMRKKRKYETKNTDEQSAETPSAISKVVCFGELYFSTEFQSHTEQVTSPTVIYTYTYTDAK